MRICVSVEYIVTLEVRVTKSRHHCKNIPFAK